MAVVPRRQHGAERLADEENQAEVWRQFHESRRPSHCCVTDENTNPFSRENQRAHACASCRLFEKRRGNGPWAHGKNNREDRECQCASGLRLVAGSCQQAPLAYPGHVEPVSWAPSHQAPFAQSPKCVRMLVSASAAIARASCWRPSHSTTCEECCHGTIGIVPLVAEVPQNLQSEVE